MWSKDSCRSSSRLSLSLDVTDLQSITRLATQVTHEFGRLDILLLGLPGIYVRQAGRAGILGLLGFLLVWYVTLFQGVMTPFANVTVIPGLLTHQVTLSYALTPPSTWTPFFIVSMVSQVLGVLLLAIATLRARVFPRWIGWLLVATLVVGVVNLVPFFPQALSNLSAVVASVAMAGFGYALLSPHRQEAMQAAPASIEAEARV